MANEDIKERIRDLENQRNRLIEGQNDYGIDRISEEIEDLEDELEKLGG